MRTLFRLGCLLALLAVAFCISDVWSSRLYGMPHGVYPVGSKIEDARAFGGFGPCNNYPKRLAGEPFGEDGKLSLLVFPEQDTWLWGYLGMRLLLVNRMNRIMEFRACDSCLYLVLEARTGPGGQWKPVEAFPQTFCGNSFHRVFLEPGEYWELSARRYSGSLKTKLRFRLEPGGEQAVTEGGQPIYSEEFDGSVSPGQFLARRNQWDE